MRILFSLIFCCLILSGSICSQTDTVTLQTVNGQLGGILQWPKHAEGPLPLVIIHPGSGPTDRDGNSVLTTNNSLLMLSDSLLAGGVATLRLDKRGVGSSKAALIAEKDLRFHHLVDDLKAWVAAYAKKDEFSKIILAGHSEGSLISMLAAHQNGMVDAFISISGPGRSADQVLRDQFAKQPPMVQDLVFPILDSLAHGHLVPDVHPLLYASFRPSVQPYIISWFAHDPSLIIGELTQPVLIIQGTTDIQVETNEADFLAKAAGSRGKKVIIQNMNHVLKVMDKTDQAAQMPTYMNPDFPLHPDLAKAIILFILNLP